MHNLLVDTRPYIIKNCIYHLKNMYTFSYAVLCKRLCKTLKVIFCFSFHFMFSKYYWGSKISIIYCTVPSTIWPIFSEFLIFSQFILIDDKLVLVITCLREWFISKIVQTKHVVTSWYIKPTNTFYWN